MSWKRVLRAAVCLLVICCLVINISPVKARALTPGIVISVAASLVVSAAFIALGVQSSSDSTPFLDAVDRCVDALTLDKWVVDGMINIFALNSGAQMGVPKSVLEAIRSWLHSEQIVKEVETVVPEGYWDYNGIVAKPYPQEVDLSQYPYILIGYSGSNGYPYCFFSSQPWKVSSRRSHYGYLWVFTSDFAGDYLYYVMVNDTDKGWKYVGDGVFSASSVSVFDLNDPYQDFQYVSRDMWSNYDIYGTAEFNYGQLLLAGSQPVGNSTTTVVVADGLSAGKIASPAVPLSVGYRDWAAGATTVSGELVDSEEDVVVYPLGIGGTVEDTLKLSQETVWTGTTITAPPIAEGLTGSLAQTGAATFVDTLVDVVTNPIISALRSLFIPDAGYIDDAIDMFTSNFPFANSIAVMGKDLKQFFLSLGSDPPVIYINLSAATGSYDYGGDMVLVDFSFYEPYKPAMDAILSAFLWLWFCWRMLLGLPGVLNGISGLPGVYSDASHVGVTRSDSSIVADPPKHVPAPGSDAHFRAWKSWRDWLSG